MNSARALLAAAFCACLALPLAAQDRYEGYYYPDVSSEEVFDRVLIDLPDPDRKVRVDFMTTLTTAQLRAPESPRYVFFAKGAEAQDLILVGLDDDVFKTPFRARAVMAQMSSNMRDSPFFQQTGLRFDATFYDLLQILRFDSLVITDGETWSHRVRFVRD